MTTQSTDRSADRPERVETPIPPLQVVDLSALAAGVTDDWKNFVVTEVNDHVVRMSVLDRDFHWHRHANSDETFLVLEGELLVDLEDRTEVLTKGKLMTVPGNVLHRTRARGRVVNLTFERRDTVIKGD